MISPYSFLDVIDSFASSDERNKNFLNDSVSAEIRNYSSVSECSRCKKIKIDLIKFRSTAYEISCGIIDSVYHNLDDNGFIDKHMIWAVMNGNCMTYGTDDSCEYDESIAINWHETYRLSFTSFTGYVQCLVRQEMERNACKC